MTNEHTYGLSADDRRTANLVVDPSATNLRSLRIGSFLVHEARFPAGHVLPEHAHEHQGLSLVLSGSYEEIVHGTAIPCGPDIGLIKNEGISHENRYLADAHILCVDLPQLPFVPAAGWAHSSRIRWLTRAMRREITQQHLGWQLLAEGAILEILGHILRLRDEPLRPRWVTELEELVRAGEVTTVTEAAARLGRSSAHIARQFRRFYGISLGESVRQLRIRRACEQLTTTSKSLATIALEIGFFDQSHFTRAFTSAMKMPPSEYRIMHRREIGEDSRSGTASSPVLGG